MKVRSRDVGVMVKHVEIVAICVALGMGVWKEGGRMRPVF